MLFLSRHEGECFCLAISSTVDPEMRVKDLMDKPIRIEIVEFHGGVCKVGIDSPRTFNVAREEVWDDNKILKIEISDGLE